MPYYKQVIDGKVVAKELSLDVPYGEGWEIIVGDPTEVEVYTEEVLIYNGDTLISWALQQSFASDIMVHMAAFLDFANKATETSKDNFFAYAGSVGLTAVANTIIAKAIELGADLEA